MYENAEFVFDFVLSNDYGIFYVSDPYSLTSDDIATWSVNLQVSSTTYPSLVKEY